MWAEVFCDSVGCFGTAALIDGREGEGDFKTGSSQEHVVFVPALLALF